MIVLISRYVFLFYSFLQTKYYEQKYLSVSFPRATTEFMGWPSPPTSTISIEELLRAAKAAATSTESSESVAASTSTTTTTTTTTPAPTTPGYCTSDCELAATIKLVGGAKWVPELLDHNTKEWQTLANEVEEQVLRIIYYNYIPTYFSNFSVH